MGHTCIGKIKNVVHFFGRQWNWRGVDPDVAIAMALCQCPGVAGVSLQMQHPVGVCVKDRIISNFFKARKLYERVQATLCNVIEALLLKFGSRYEINRGTAVCGRSVLAVFRLRFRSGLSTVVLGCVLIGARYFVDYTGAVYAAGINNVFVSWQVLQHVRGTADVGNVFYIFACCESVGNFDYCAFGITVQQDVCFGVDQQRAADFVLPVVVMRNPSQ